MSNRDNRDDDILRVSPSYRDTRYNRHYPRPDLKVVAQGELLVTGHGEVVLAEHIHRSRAALVHSDEAVEVVFKPEEHHHHPPCAPTTIDVLEWEVIERDDCRDLFLKIKWSVSTARTVLWYVYEVR